METTGLEPATSGLQSRRSPSWATSPGTRWSGNLKSQISNLKFQIYKWAREDSNFRPHAYQACALTNWATSPKSIEDITPIKVYNYAHRRKSWLYLYSFKRAIKKPLIICQRLIRYDTYYVGSYIRNLLVIRILFNVIINLSTRLT